jgi:hypothetical protein
MKRFLLVLVLLLVGGAWLAGYWPQRQRLAALETEVESLRVRTATAEARARTGALLAEVRNLEDAVMRQNYGDAQQISVGFFEHVRAEAANATDPAVRQALEGVAGRREAVTAALARADATVLAALQETEAGLRRALGYPVYGSNPAVPAAGAAPTTAPAVPAAPPPITAPAASPAAPVASPSA